MSIVQDYKGLDLFGKSVVDAKIKELKHAGKLMGFQDEYEALHWAGKQDRAMEILSYGNLFLVVQEHHSFELKNCGIEKHEIGVNCEFVG